MALRQSTRDCSGDQPPSRAASKQPSPQLPGRYEKTWANENTSLIASAIDVAGSNDEPAVTDGTESNEGNRSIKGQQDKVSGNNKGDDSNNADIGKSDGKVGNDNDGNGGINKDKPVVTNGTNNNEGNSSIKGQQGKVGDNNKGNNSNDADTGKSDGKVGNDNDSNRGINSNEVNDLDSEDDSSASSGGIRFSCSSKWNEFKTLDLVVSNKLMFSNVMDFIKQTLR